MPITPLSCDPWKGKVPIFDYIIKKEIKVNFSSYLHLTPICIQRRIEENKDNIRLDQQCTPKEEIMEIWKGMSRTLETPKLEKQN